MILNLTDLSSESLQSQIARQIRARILAGELGASADLPSIRALARNHHISVITVQRAYESLEREGLIHSRRGKGFYVSELSDNTKKEKARQRLMEHVRPEINAAMAEGLTKDDIDDVIEKIMAHNGT